MAGLGSLAALRSRTGCSVQEDRRTDAIYACYSPQGGMDLANPTSASHRQWLCISSQFIKDDDARVSLLNALEAPAEAEPRLLRFSPGRRERAWSANCVGIGLAAGFLEPLESTSIFLIQAAVTDLVNLMPLPGAGRVDPRLTNEFNRLNALQYERVRDFLVLHYIANRRVGEPLWDYLRSVPLPDTLEHKLQLFRSRAALPNYQYGLFARDSLAVSPGGTGHHSAGV